jgi:NitT/TauT family transport system substrate-binding protein
MRSAVLAICVLFIVAGCAAGPAASGNPKVIVGSGADATYSPMIVAVDKGFFAKHGIDASYRVFDAGNLTIEAAASGTTNIGAAGELTGLSYLAKGAHLQWVATDLVTGKSGGTCVAEGISAPDDLKGTKAGTQIGTTTHLWASLFLDHYGLTKDVELVNIGQPDMIPAIARGDIKSFFSVEPWMTRAQEEVAGVTCPWRYDHEGIYQLHHAFFFNEDWMKANPTTAENALKALLETVDWIKANPEETAKVVSGPLRTPEDQILFQLNNIEWLGTFDEPELRGHFTNKIIPFVTKMKLVPVADPAELTNRMLNPALLKKVAPDRVTAP